MSKLQTWEMQKLKGNYLLGKGRDAPRGWSHPAWQGTRIRQQFSKGAKGAKANKFLTVEKKGRDEDKSGEAAEGSGQSEEKQGLRRPTLPGTLQAVLTSNLWGLCFHWGQKGSGCCCFGKLSVGWPEAGPRRKPTPASTLTCFSSWVLLCK